MYMKVKENAKLIEKDMKRFLGSEADVPCISPILLIHRRECQWQPVEEIKRMIQSSILKMFSLKIHWLPLGR